MTRASPYEEWIYGALPQDVVFVRFVGDEVVLVKIAKVSGEVITKTQKEVQVARRRAFAGHAEIERCPAGREGRHSADADGSSANLEATG